MALALFGLSACSLSSRPSTIPPGSSTGIVPGAPQTTDSQPVELVTMDPEVFDACVNATPNPLAQSIAEAYETPYQEVAAWFCSGFSYENIMVALETGKAVEIPPDTLLQMLLEKDWEEIWAEIGFTGEP